MKTLSRAIVLSAFSCGVLVPIAGAQKGLEGLPEESQAAAVEQRIGVTDLRVEYHRPGVKGREIWGGVVPHGQVWRAGANENTVLSVSHPFKVEGHDLPAGRYGLHLIPNAEAWTLILSKDSTSWGSFFYRQEQDALRVELRPEAAPHQEWLSYSIDDPSEGGAVVAMRWDKLRVPFRIETDSTAHALASIREQLRSLAGFGWLGRSQAAQWCLDNKINHEEAMKWIDRAIANRESANHLAIKAGLLEATGKPTEAEPLWEKAVKIGSESEVNLLGYNLLLAGSVDRAIAMFERNLAGHPRSWNAHDSLAEAYVKVGKTKLAIEHYRKAQEMTTDAVQKERIAGALKQLEKN